MLKILSIFFLIPLVIVFSSCEDVIKRDVPFGEAKLVVDAFVNNLPQKQVIRLTRSIPYFNLPGSEPGVTGAKVAIVDTSNSNIKLFEFADSGKGNYIFKPNALTGDTFTVGHNYILLIVEGGDTLLSLSHMHPTIKIDSLGLVKEDGKTLGFKKGYYVELFGNDLKGQGNTYWIKTYNQKLAKDKKSYLPDSFANKIGELNLAYDMTQTPNGQDGGAFIWPVRYGTINDFGNPRDSGTRVRVEVHSITNETFYWFQLVISENQNGGLFATPPINIGTNIFNLNSKKSKAIGGFFSMSAVATAKKEIP